jgi:hypothetical protein
LLESLDLFPPARDLLARRRNYFIGVLDPCASIEFTRGCPWDCSFCSAWTFYGRSYRMASAEAAGEDLAAIKEPNVFIVDDVAFIHPEHGFAIGREIERRGISSNITWRPGRTCSSATRRSSPTGRSWGSNISSSGWRRSTRRGSSCIASAPRRA